MVHESVDIDRYLSHSAKIQMDDLDWNAAVKTGLSADEKFILTYFSDIEGQTIFYLRDLLNTKVTADPEATAFLTMWNYEEFFHGQTLAHLLKECGHPLGTLRNAEVRRSSQISETVLSWASRIVSKILPDSFLALYMSWGALNELTTLRGYERLCDTTANPVLREICERIAKQERRHFAWYFNSARERLEKSSGARQFTKTMLRLFWTPVGAGVKSDTEVVRLIGTLFPDKHGEDLARGIDEKIATLPGLTRLKPMQNFMKNSALI